MVDLNRLKKLNRRKKFGGNDKQIKYSKLEDNFLQFVHSLSNRKELFVKTKDVYEVQGDEIEHVKEVIDALRLNMGVPENLDFGGFYKGMEETTQSIFLSVKQREKDLFNENHIFLGPLLKDIYVKGDKLLFDFSIKEAIYAKLSYARNGLDLLSFHDFKNSFEPGPYLISAKLETPAKSIAKYKSLSEQKTQLIKKSQEFLSDPNLFNKFVEESIELTDKLGALYRYRIPKETIFSEKTNYVFLDLPLTDCFYLYNEKKDTNTLIYFGSNPLTELVPTRKLHVVDGNKPDEAIKQLISDGFYKPSSLVIKERINNLKSLTQSNSDLGKVVDALEEIDSYLEMRSSSEEKTINYINSLDSFLLNFTLVPVDNSAVLKQLLPRLSSTGIIREYTQGKLFKQRFTHSHYEAQKDLLGKLTQHLYFSNQQNNEVNTWLYLQHKNTCEDAGITFKLF